MIDYRCDKCGTVLASDDALAGKADPCPLCGHPNQVPPPSKHLQVTLVTAVVSAIILLLAGLSVYMIVQFVVNPTSSPASFQPQSSTDGAPVTGAPGPTAAPAEAPAAPLIVRTASNVDERLFLLRALDDLYRQIPMSQPDATAMQSELGQLRHQGKKFELYVNSKQLGDDLSGLFGDFVATLDAYSDLLASLDMIQRDAVRQADQDTTQAVLDAGIEGGSTAIDAYNQGYSGDESAGLGAVTALVSGAIEKYENNQRLEDAKRQAEERAFNVFQNQRSSAQARIEVVVADLTSRFGWQKGEAGFDEDAEDAQIREFATAKNGAGVLQLIVQRATRRPRDPFIQAVECRFVAGVYEIDRKPEEMIVIARGCLDCANRVPESEVYDPYRLRFLLEAGDIASRAYAVELKADGLYSGKSNATASFAVRIWDACLQYSNDPTGEIRERRAWAIGAGGDLAGALKEASVVTPLRGETARFAYNNACIQSRLGNVEESYRSLDYAISKLGFDRIADAKSDPDLTPLRQRKSQEFQQLLAVKTTWNIKWGYLNDDIILTNNSKFPISNVSLVGRLEQDGRVWPLSLSADVIEAGQTRTWENVVSIPGRRLTGGSFDVSCDQNK